MKNIPTNRVTVEPVIEPVTVSDVKLQAMIATSVTQHDALLLQEILEARQTVEQLTNRSLITQTREQYYDELSEDIYLRYGPVQSVSSITYKDSNEVSQTLTASLYTVDTKSIPGRVVIGYDKTYPSSITDTNSVVVTYVAGYGTVSTAVPIIYRRAIAKLAAYRFTHREFGEDDSVVMEALVSMLQIAGATLEYA